MTKYEAVIILTEMQKWRRCEGKYDEPGALMPFTAIEYGKALDVAIEHLKNACDKTTKRPKKKT